MTSLIIVGRGHLRGQDWKQEAEAFVGCRKPALELERNRCVAEWTGLTDLVAEGRQECRGVKDDFHIWDISHCIHDSVILLSYGSRECD